MKNLFITIAFLSALLGGCDNIADEQPAATQPAKPVSVLLPDGKTISIAMETTTPKGTKYRGEGIVYKRTVDASRFLDITGVSPGEVASRVEAAKIITGAAPAINISPDGIDAKETKQATTFVGTSGQWGIFSTIWQRIKDFFKGAFIWIIVGAALLFVLPMLVPAAGPICAAIWGAIKTAFSWIINMFVPVVAFFKSLFVTKAATQVVQAQETFKTNLNSSPQQTFTKEEVITLLKNANNKHQDANVQTFVDMIKKNNA